MWLRKLLAELFGQMIEQTMIHSNNWIYVLLSMNLVFHDKSKHIEIQYHYICDMVQRGAIHLQYVSTDNQTVDILTKPLPRAKFVYFCDQLGAVEDVSLVKRDD